MEIPCGLARKKFAFTASMPRRPGQKCQLSDCSNAARTTLATDARDYQMVLAILPSGRLWFERLRAVGQTSSWQCHLWRTSEFTEDEHTGVGMANNSAATTIAVLSRALKLRRQGAGKRLFASRSTRDVASGSVRAATSRSAPNDPSVPVIWRWLRASSEIMCLETQNWSRQPYDSSPSPPLRQLRWFQGRGPTSSIRRHTRFLWLTSVSP
jgi:hypothetical protein